VIHDERMGLTERQIHDRKPVSADEHAALAAAGYRRNLAYLLTQVSRLDADAEPNYAMREMMLLEALLLARRVGIPAGFRLDPAEPDWPVLLFELPTGQVSWHMPGHPTPWDGHGAEAKAGRIAAFKVWSPQTAQTAQTAQEDLT
jgi:hypothetical protein